MSKDKQKQGISPEREMKLTLDELVRWGARQVIQQEIELVIGHLKSNHRMDRCHLRGGCE